MGSQSIVFMLQNVFRFVSLEEVWLSGIDAASSSTGEFCSCGFSKALVTVYSSPLIGLLRYKVDSAMPGPSLMYRCMAIYKELR